MRAPFAALIVAACLSCTDSGNINGVDKENLSLRIDVTGDASLAPVSFRLSLDGINWQTVSGGKDLRLLVPPGSHTVGLTPFDNILDLGWCLQLDPSSIGAQFKQSRVIYARFNVYCPSATGIGSLTLTVKTLGMSGSAPFSVKFTRIVGIPGSETLVVRPETSLQASLTAGLYRIDLLNAGFCKLVASSAAGVPAIPVRNGESSALTLTVGCTPPFTLPPGVP